MAIYGAWVGLSNSMHQSDAFNLSTEEGLRSLASRVQPGDVVIYTTTGCPYCAQAKNWMSHYGFSFTECNAETESQCERELMATGSRGVPTLRVLGQVMRDGFDSEEFVALLQ